MVEECVFCKIVKKEITSDFLYEDEAVIAFLDQHPVAHGHALVVPRKHFKTILDVPSSLLGHMMGVVKKIALKQIKELKAEGFNVRINNFKPAGQLVMHSHIHVIPRFKNDNLKDDNLKDGLGAPYKEGEIDSIVKSLEVKD